jgi:hypothetical protein
LYYFFKNFEKVVQMIELNKFEGAPNGYTYPVRELMMPTNVISLNNTANR